MATQQARGTTIDALFSEERRYPPPEDFAARANAQPDIYERDWEEFWETEGRGRVTWFEPFQKLYEWEPPYAKWYLGGKLNVCFNCVDRHVEAGQGDKVAFYWEGEPPDERREITFADLQRDVVRFANALKKIGVTKGTPVAIYMGMVPELPIAMLACTRLGAPHTVVFGGFSADSLAGRVNDMGCQVLITQDEGWRKGNRVPLKRNADDALEQCPSVERVVVLERTGGDVEEATGERAELPSADAVPDGDPRTRALALLSALRALVTGYDLGAAQARQLVTEYGAVRDQLPVDDPELLRGELAVLTTFADLCELARNRPASEEEEADTQVHSPREYFHAYLHSLDVEREALPESFRTRLGRALLHYGVEDLEPGPALVEAVHRIFLSQQRIGEQLPAVSALLDRWLTAERPPEGPARAEVGEVLDRLVVATQLRYPAVGDLARAVRYRYFEEPVVREARQRVLE